MTIKEIAAAQGWRYREKTMPEKTPPPIAKKKMEKIKAKMQGLKTYRVENSYWQSMTDVYFIKAKDEESALDFFYEHYLDPDDTTYGDTDGGETAVFPEDDEDET